MLIHIFARRAQIHSRYFSYRHSYLCAAIALLVLGFAAPNSSAQDLGEIGVPADLACASLLQEYLKGNPGYTAPCDEGLYETVMDKPTACPAVVKQRAQKARSLCVSLKATQADIDACNQTENVDRALAGCTRIVNDQAQSVADRTFAFIQHGNIQTGIDHQANAMSSYDRALKLDPKNTLAYAARAIATWKFGAEMSYMPGFEPNMRLDAIADYRKAMELDPAATKEMTAASPDLKIIADTAAKTPANAKRQRVRGGE